MALLVAVDCENDVDVYEIMRLHNIHLSKRDWSVDVADLLRIKMLKKTYTNLPQKKKLTTEYENSLCWHIYRIALIFFIMVIEIDDRMLQPCCSRMEI